MCCWLWNLQTWNDVISIKKDTSDRLSIATVNDTIIHFRLPMRTCLELKVFVGKFDLDKKAFDLIS